MIRLYSSMFILLSLLTSRHPAIAQTRVVLTPGIRIPLDSVKSGNLLSSLSEFIDSIDAGATTHPWMAARDRAQTLDLADEISGMQKSRKYKDDHFYKPTLMNIVAISDTAYLLQLSFLGIAEDLPLLRASFELFAYENKDNMFSFSSPVSWNTAQWKLKTIGGTTYHYQDKLNFRKAKNYQELVSAFDRKLGHSTPATEYYSCRNAVEALRVLGIVYKSDYSGRKNISLTASDGTTSVVVCNQDSTNFHAYDPHDLWHARLRLAVPVSKINKAVDEGCAYLYGGSWGLSWEEIYRQFHEKLVAGKKSDWLELCETNHNFARDKEPELIAGYVINALIVRKLEKEKGFAAVMELLQSSPGNKVDESYFRTLTRLTGITRENFNDEVSRLLLN